jgi:prolyl oligopeptidase
MLPIQWPRPTRFAWMILGSLGAISCASAPTPAPTPVPIAAPAPSTKSPSPSTSPPTDAREASSSLPPAPALARTGDVVETLHGVSVADPYRWMESDHDALNSYLSAQGEYARALFARIPGREGLLRALHIANTGVTRVAIDGEGGGRVFLEKRGPDEDLWKLYVRDGWAGTDRLLVDPTARAAGDAHYAIDYATPSPDGKHVAYGISRSGSEDSVIEVIEVDSGKVLDEKIDRAQYAAISWTPDSKSFFYWRRAASAPDSPATDVFRNARVFHHLLGSDPEAELPIFGPGTPGVTIPDTYFTAVSVAPGSPWALGFGSQGTSADQELWLARLAEVRPGKTPWRKAVGTDAHVKDVAIHGNELFLLTYDGAPHYRVDVLDLTKGAKGTRRPLVPESAAVIEGMACASDALYVRLLDNGLSAVLRYDFKTHKVGPIPLPQAGSVGGLVTDPKIPGVRFQLSSWTLAPRWFEFDPKTGKTRDLGLIDPWPIDYSQIASEEVEAASADGTNIPCSIVHRQDLRRDGTTPTLVTAYGAYGDSTMPFFSPALLTWVDRGGVLVVAHVRGGGERGEEWHLGGIKAKKENGVDDFIACTKYAIDQKITAPARLAIMGTSAGGIIVGGFLTKRPDLISVALVRVGVSDLLSFERTAGGPANVPEFGSVANADDFAYLLASSPYHRVKTGTSYPAVALTTGMHDPRVPSWQPAKMAARLQSASSSGRPIVLRVEGDAGHGIGSTRAQGESELADLYAFVLWQMGLSDFQMH